MSGFFCSYGRNEDYATEEAYRKIVKRKAARAACLLVLGLITIAVVLSMQYLFGIEMDDYMSGFLMGAGTGLFFAGVAIMIKRLRMLKDEKKLKAARIAEADERNRSISEAALRIAAAVLLISMYVVMIIALAFTKEIVQVMSMLICLFLVVYVAAYKILQRKM